MSTITTRAGKGSPLTNSEVDANFTNLNNDKLESGDNVSTLINDAGYATTSYVDTAESVAVTTANAYTDTAVANLVDSSPATLDTLNELAAALGDDPNFATTVTNSIGTKLDSSHDMTLTLAGDASGSATFTNMGNATLTVAVADDSHNHTIANVDGLQTALDGKVDDSQVLTNVPAGAVFTDTVYTHPSYAGDDINLDTGALSGATVISDLDFNVTTDTQGHVTDANATYSTRNLTYSDVGAQPAGDYVLTTGDVMTGTLRLDNSANLTFYDHNGTFPTQAGAFIWDLNNDSARIYANQPASDQIDFVFKITDNAVSTDRFKFWVDDYRGSAYDRYPLYMHGSATYIQCGDNGSGDINVGTARLAVPASGNVTIDGNTVFHDGYHPNADKWTTARTLSLSGDASGSVSWDGSANATLSVTVNDDSHNHTIANVDGLQTALDGKAAASHSHSYLPLSGGSLTGNVSSTGTITADSLLLTNDASDTSRHRVSVFDSGSTSYGMMLWNTSGTSGDWSTMIYGPNQSGRRISFGKINDTTFTNHADVTEIAYFDLDDSTLRLDADAYVGSNKVFHDGYHPNADKWTTARTLSLTGDVTGSTSWDGSANATLSVTVANDSHTHDGRYYTESEADNRFLRKTISAVTATATTTLNFSTADNFKVTLGLNTTLAFSNLVAGQQGVIYLVQDATGGRTFTLPAIAKTPKGGASIVQETGASTVSILSYTVLDTSNVLVNYIGDYA